MRKFILIFLFLFSNLCFADYIREFVCIVRPKYNKYISDAIKDTADALSSIGYKDFAEAVESKTKDDVFFGSGFIVILGGKSYCITNYHVVAYAHSASIEIQNAENGQHRKIEACKVIAYDEERDLAIVEIPASENITKGLSFYEGNIRDGVEVWSAGYPGLGKEPLWQLGRGNISNTRVYLDELTPTRKTHFFQHSAPIDSGNSGGPLLIASKNSPLGYEVIGVNTATAIRRQNTNFAIPYSVVTDFLNVALGSFDTSKKNASFNEAKSMLISLSSYDNIPTKEDEAKNYEVKRLKSLAFLMSNQNAIDFGIDTLKNTLLQAPSYVFNTLISQLVYSHPIDGLKLSLAYNLEKDLNDYKTFSSADITEEKTDMKKVTFKNQGVDKLNTQWVFSNNKWYLNNFAVNSLIAEKTDKEKFYKKAQSSGPSFGIAIIQAYKNIVFVEYNGLMTKSGLSSGANIGIAHNFTYVDLGFFLNLQQKRLAGLSGSSEYSNFKKISFAGMFFLEPSIPISFTDTFTLMPYARLALGIAFNPDIYTEVTRFDKRMTSFTLNVFTGFRFIFNVNGAKIALNVAYLGRFIPDSKKYSIEKLYLNGFSVGLGYSF